MSESLKAQRETVLARIDDMEGLSGPEAYVIGEMLRELQRGAVEAWLTKDGPADLHWYEVEALDTLLDSETKR